MFTKSDNLSDDDVKEISLEFINAVINLNRKDIHPMDVASLFIFLGLTVWRTHTNHKDFIKLVEQFEIQDWNNFPTMQVMFPEVQEVLKDLEKVQLENDEPIDPRDLN